MLEQNKLKDLNDDLYKAINKILIAHRNTKLFMFLCSGPFAIMLWLIKFSLKLTIVAVFHKKH
jgi:hypothetical protein